MMTAPKSKFIFSFFTQIQHKPALILEAEKTRALDTRFATAFPLFSLKVKIHLC